MAKINLLLEMELGVTGGEEDNWIPVRHSFTVNHNSQNMVFFAQLHMDGQTGFRCPLRRTAWTTLTWTRPVSTLSLRRCEWGGQKPSLESVKEQGRKRL